MNAPGSSRPPARRWRDLRLSTRAALLATQLVLVTCCLEVSVRLYWQLARGVPALHTRLIWRSFFEELEDSGVADAPESREDGTFDVLVLGASVFHKTFGDLGPLLEEGLQKHLNRPVRVSNLAYPGRTTLDSWEKYRRLPKKRFDLVVVYHGINDVYLNNCPEHVFRADYAHAPRFFQIQLLERHPEHGAFALPYSLRYLKSRLARQLQLSTEPGPRWHHHGAVLKTPPSFRANLEKILSAARERGEPVLLMTFAVHIPEDYTEEAFEAGQLDYDGHLQPLRLWGLRENVLRGVEAHNEVTRDLARRWPNALFVDQARLMPTGRRYYDDPCHFTAEGRRQFITNILQHLDARTIEGHTRGWARDCPADTDREGGS